MDELISQRSQQDKRRRWQIPLACGLVGVLIGLTGRSLLERHEITPPEPDVHVLAEVIAEVRDNYVDRATSSSCSGGMRRMSGLDEHSVFLDQHAYGESHEQTTGHFGGIGVSDVRRRRVQDHCADRRHAGFNTPAVAGDELISIDTQPVLGRTLDQITDALRGPGTSVQLAVRRDGFDLDFAIRRNDRRRQRALPSGTRLWLCAYRNSDRHRPRVREGGRNAAA
jgi:carboxyl-terminal processing protease